MKEADKIINFRPELSTRLKKIKNKILHFYKQDQRISLYTYLGLIEEKKGNTEISFILYDAAKCLNNNNYNAFYDLFKEKLNNIEVYPGLGNIHEAKAALIMFNTYNEYIKTEKTKIFDEFTDLTKMEKYMIDSYFNKLSAPLRNPNICAKEGYHRCYYEIDDRASFSEDMKKSVEYIEENCALTLEFFNTPDENINLENEEGEEKEI